MTPNEKAARLAKLARELGRLRDEAAKLGEDSLAFQIATAAAEAARTAGKAITRA